MANNNQLSGNIPNFTNLPNLANLVVCPGNNLGGFIPNFANCPFLNVNAMDFSCVRSVHLIGTAYYDINNNCQQDTDEPSIPNALIQVNGGEHYAYTNNNGNYHIGADVGTYTLSVQAPNALWDTSMVCTNTFSITTENYGDTLYQNFALQANILCSLLSVDIGTAELRPCFSSIYNVQYCNQGTLPQDAAYIDITLPDALTLQTADLPYTQPQAGVYRFEVGDLAIGQCHSFTFTVLVDCGATLGTTACVLANINPIPDCWSSLVDGYQLAVSGDCNGNEVLFTIENLNGDMPDSTQYRIYQDDILSAVGNVKLQSMEQKNISITGNGSLYRLVVKNNSTSIYASDPQALVANCGGNSLFGAFLLNVSEGDDSPFFERDCQIIIGSYDPNDKQAVPRGIGEQHIVAKNEEIEFTVRFQNTGTADAINIFILDTLDLQNLDFSTLRMGIVSHEYTTELTGNVLRINFDNIHLPDSTTNEPASHGFVKYHIRTKSNLNGGETINNTANIYFDYNAPITTNTTQHTINQAPTAIDDNTEVLKDEATLLNLIMNDLNDEGTPQISGFTAPIHGTLSALNNQLLYLPNPNYLGTDVFSYFITDYFGETDTATVVLQVVNALIVGDIPQQTFSLYPNPTQGQLSVVNIGALHTNANAQFLLFDAVGRQVFSTTLSAQNSTILQLGQLPTALYSYKIVNQQNETLQTGKLTVMNY
ncbi:MAG: T9SS type A sorting domain-containing protein [Sphingobacteriales bacterium]|nr:T9SS type A sorting domain-containing protein [Sphingobacteriales bacterium]